MYFPRRSIIRRGRSFGPPLPAATTIDDGASRGLYFICLQASIARGFEFIQQTWINNPKFNGLHNDRDPLLGNNQTPLSKPDDGEPALLPASEMPLLNPAGHRHDGNSEELCRISHCHEVVEADLPLVAEPGPVAHDYDRTAYGSRGSFRRRHARRVLAADMCRTGRLWRSLGRRLIGSVAAEAAPIRVDPEGLDEVVPPRHMLS